MTTTAQTEPDWRASYPHEADAAAASQAWGNILAELNASNPAALATHRHAVLKLVDVCVVYDRAARQVADSGETEGPQGCSPAVNRAWATMRTASGMSAALEVVIGLSTLRRLPDHRSADAYSAPRWIDRTAVAPGGEGGKPADVISETGSEAPSAPRPVFERGASCP